MFASASTRARSLFSARTVPTILPFHPRRIQPYIHLYIHVYSEKKKKNANSAAFPRRKKVLIRNWRRAKLVFICRDNWTRRAACTDRCNCRTPSVRIHRESHWWSRTRPDSFFQQRRHPPARLWSYEREASRAPRRRSSTGSANFAWPRSPVLPASASSVRPSEGASSSSSATTAASSRSSLWHDHDLSYKEFATPRAPIYRRPRAKFFISPIIP